MRGSRVAAHWPLLLPLLVAGWLRLRSLTPAPYFGDAAEYAMVARSLAANPLDLAYPDVEGFGPTPFVSQPPLALYLFALFIRLTGSVELGPVLASALMGTATIAVVYAIGARLASRWTGAAAGLFLAVLPYHVRVSREAQLDGALALMVCLGVLAFLAWQARPSALRASLLGAALAGATFTKLPGFLLFGVLAVAMAQVAWSRRAQPETLKPLWRDAALALAPTAFLLSLYLGLLWWLQSTANLLGKLAWQAGRVAGHDTVSRPWHWYFTETEVGLGGQLGPLLLLMAAVGALLAGVDMARDPTRRAGLVALLAWPLLFLAFLVASDRKEWFYAIPLSPAFALLAAWPVGAAVRWVRPDDDHDASLAHAHGSGHAPAAPGHPMRPSLARSRQRPEPDIRLPSVKPMAIGALVILSSVAVWLPVEDTLAGPGAYGTGVREAALWIHETDPTAAQVGTTLGRFTLAFFNGQPTYHVWLNHTFVEGEVAAGRVRYVVLDGYATEGEERAWLEGLAARHHGELVREHRAEGVVQVQVWRVSP